MIFRHVGYADFGWMTLPRPGRRGRRPRRPVRGSEGSGFGLFGGGHSLALTGKFEDDTVMDESVDGGHGGHGIVEDFIPLGEGKIGGEHEGPALVTFGEEVEEDLHFRAGMLHIADVVDEDEVEAGEPLELIIESELLLCP